MAEEINLSITQRTDALSFAAKRKVMRAISLGTLLVFLVNTAASDRVWAAPNFEMPATRLGESPLASLPQKLGVVRDYQPSTGQAPFILHIQDAHSNPSAQKNIAKILQWIYEQKLQAQPIIALEGVQGSLHPEYLNFFPGHPQVNQSLVRHLVNQGELTGAELFAWKKAQQRVTSNESSSALSLSAGLRRDQPSTIHYPRFVGVEDAKLYRENLEVYREFLEHETEISTTVDVLRRELYQRENNVLSKEAREYLREKRRRKDGDYQTSHSNPQWEAYLAYLKKKLREKVKLDLDAPFEQVRFPNVVRLDVLMTAFKDLNRETAVNEKDTFLNELERKVRLAQDKEMVRTFKEYDGGKELRELAEQLWALALSYRLDPQLFSGFWKMTGRDILRAELDVAGLDQEMNQLEMWLEDSLAHSEEAKKVFKLGHDFDLLEKTLSLELTAKQLEVGSGKLEEKAGAGIYLNMRISFDSVLSLTQNKELQKVLTPWIQKSARFYDLATQRDKILLENTLQAAKGGQIAVLITGGFHTEGFKALMGQRGIGYAVIQPNMNVNHEDLYRKVLREENADISAYLEKSDLNRQEALFFKTIVEKGASKLWEKDNVSHQEIAAEAAEALRVHPVLKDRLTARAAPKGKQGSLLEVREAKPVPEQVFAEFFTSGSQAVVATPVTNGVEFFSKLSPRRPVLSGGRAMNASVTYQPAGTSVLVQPEPRGQSETARSEVRLFEEGRAALLRLKEKEPRLAEAAGLAEGMSLEKAVELYREAVSLYGRVSGSAGRYEGREPVSLIQDERAWTDLFNNLINVFHILLFIEQGEDIDAEGWAYVLEGVPQTLALNTLRDAVLAGHSKEITEIYSRLSVTSPEATRYTAATDEEKARVLEEIKGSTARGLADYGARFLAGVKNSRTFFEIGLPSEGEWREAEERRVAEATYDLSPQRVFHEGLLKDEKGVYWIVKKLNLSAREAWVEDRETKNYPERERLAFLLAEGRANLTEIRLMDAKQAEQGGLTGDPSHYYLSRVVTPSNYNVSELPHQEWDKAYAGLFVANILMRKFDPHTFNVGHVGALPVALDHDGSLLFDVYSNDVQRNRNVGFERFVTALLMHSVVKTTRHLKPSDPKGIFLDDMFALNDITKYDYSLGWQIIENMATGLGLGAGYIEAEGLTAENIRQSISDFKNFKNVRVLAEQAGYKGEALEAVTRFIEENQLRLGQDVDFVWRQLTGRSGGFQGLDQTQSVSENRRVDARSEVRFFEEGKALLLKIQDSDPRLAELARLAEGMDVEKAVSLYLEAVSHYGRGSGERGRYEDWSPVELQQNRDAWTDIFNNRVGIFHFIRFIAEGETIETEDWRNVLEFVPEVLALKIIEDAILEGRPQEIMRIYERLKSSRSEVRTDEKKITPRSPEVLAARRLVNDIAQGAFGRGISLLEPEGRPLLEELRTRPTQETLRRAEQFVRDNNFIFQIQKPITLNQVRGFLDSRPHAVWYVIYNGENETVEYVNQAFATVFGKENPAAILEIPTYLAINPPGSPVEQYKTEDHIALHDGIFMSRSGNPAVTVVKVEFGNGVLGFFMETSKTGEVSLDNLEPELLRTLQTVRPDLFSENVKRSEVRQQDQVLGALRFSLVSGISEDFNYQRFSEAQKEWEAVFNERWIFESDFKSRMEQAVQRGWVEPKAKPGHYRLHREAIPAELLFQAEAAREAAKEFGSDEPARTFRQFYEGREAQGKVLATFPVEKILYDFLLLPTDDPVYQLTWRALSLSWSLFAFAQIRSLYNLLPASGRRKDLLPALEAIPFQSATLETEGGNYRVINRRTWSGRYRFARLDSELSRFETAHRGESFQIGDFAVSDGRTAVDLARHVEKRNVRITASDYRKNFFIHSMTAFDEDGTILQVRKRGASRLYERREVDPEARDETESLYARALERGQIGDQVKKVSFIHPDVESYAIEHPGVFEIRRDDIFKPNEDRTYHFIRVMGLLMPGDWSYFSDEKIGEALAALGRRLEEGGALEIGMSGGATDQFALYRRSGDRLRAETISGFEDYPQRLREVSLRSEVRTETDESFREVLAQSANALTWHRVLSEYTPADAQDKINVTLQIERGIQMKVPMLRSILSDPALQEFTYRYLAAWAYNLSIIYGTSFVAAGVEGEPDLVDAGKIHALLLEGGLSNIRESLTKGSKNPLGIKNYANAGKQVEVKSLEELTFAEKEKKPVSLNIQLLTDVPGVYLGVDVGGGSAKMTVIHNGRLLHLPDDLRTISTLAYEGETVVFETPEAYVKRMSERMVAILDYLYKHYGIEKLDGVGINTPGAADFASNRMETLGQIPVKKKWNQAQTQQAGRDLPLKIAEILKLPADHVRIRNDMDGVLPGVASVLAAAKPEFWQRTGGNFAFDWMGTGHGFQFAIGGVPMNAPTEAGHMIDDFAKEGAKVFDTEAYTSIPSMLRWARQMAQGQKIDWPEIKKDALKPLVDAVFSEDQDETALKKKAVAKKVFERFAQKYAASLALRYHMVQASGQGSATEVLLGGGVARGQTGVLLRELTLKALADYGLDSKINITVITDDEIKAAGVDPDDVGPIGAAYFIQSVLASQSRSEVRLGDVDKTASLPEGLRRILVEKGYTLIRQFETGGSAAETLLVAMSDGRQAVLKYANWEGIGGNGIPWLRSQVARLRAYRAELPVEQAAFFPEVYDFVKTPEDAYYVMEFFPEAVPITEYFFKAPNSKTVLAELSSFLRQMTRLYEVAQEPAPQNYISEMHLKRLKYRVGLLAQHEGPVYERLLKGREVTAGGRRYADASDMFETLFRKEKVRVNGRLYPNLPQLIEMLEKNITDLNRRLSPKFIPKFVHGDLLLRNILRTPNGELKLIDLRGTDIHAKTPSRIGIAYELGKMMHSLLFELIRNDQFQLTLDPEADEPFFNLQFAEGQGTQNYLEARSAFERLVKQNRPLMKLVEDGSDWEAHALLSEAVHFATDAVNRFSQDATGQHALAYYGIAVVELSAFLQSQGMLEGITLKEDPMTVLTEGFSTVRSEMRSGSQDEAARKIFDSLGTRSPKEVWKMIKRELETHDPNLAQKKEGYLPRLYHALKRNLYEIQRHQDAGRIHPEIPLETFMYRDNPAPAAVSPELDRPLKIGFLPVAGNPINWGHILIALVAMNRLKLDRVIFRIQGEINYKNVPESDKVSAADRHALGEDVLSDFAPLLSYADVGLRDDHEGMEGMFEFSRALNQDKNIQFFYILGSETEKRTVSYMDKLYEQWQRFPEFKRDPNRSLEYVLMQRGEFGRQLMQKKAGELMRSAAEKSGAKTVFPVHVLRGRDVDLNIASTFYREGGDDGTVPRKVHEFGVKHQRWGNVVDAQGRLRSRTEVFKEHLLPTEQKIFEVMLERMRAKPGNDLMGVFAFDGPSGAGKSTVAEELDRVILREGGGLAVFSGVRGAGEYASKVLDIDLFLKPRPKRQRIERFVAGEERDPDGKILPKTYLDEHTFFRAGAIKKLFREIQEFRLSGRQEQEFVIKNPYIRRPATDTSPLPDEYRFTLKRNTILLVVGKYVLDYQIPGFYDATFRIMDEPGRNIALFQKRVRFLNPKDEIRQIIFYERALQPSYEEYARRTDPFVTHDVDLTREMFELRPHEVTQTLKITPLQVLHDTRFLYDYRVTTLPKRSPKDGLSFDAAIHKARRQWDLAAMMALLRLQSLQPKTVMGNLLIHPQRGEGIILLGAPGVGKSRTSSLIHGREGWQLGSDDAFQVFFVDGQIIAGLDAGIHPASRTLTTRAADQGKVTAYSGGDDETVYENVLRDGQPIFGVEKFVNVKHVFFLQGSSSLPNLKSVSIPDIDFVLKFGDERFKQFPMGVFRWDYQKDRSLAETRQGLADRILDMVEHRSLEESQNPDIQMIQLPPRGEGARSEVRSDHGGADFRARRREQLQRAAGHEDEAIAAFEILSRKQKKSLNIADALEFFGQFLSSIDDRYKSDSLADAQAVAAQGLRAYMELLSYREKRTDGIAPYKISDQPVFDGFPPERSELIVVTRDRPGLTAVITGAMQSNLVRDWAVFPAADLKERVIVMVFEMSRDDKALGYRDLSKISEDVKAVLSQTAALAEEKVLEGRQTNAQGIYHGRAAVLQGFGYGVSEVVYDIYAGLNDAELEPAERAKRKLKLAREDAQRFYYVMEEKVLPLIETLPETLGLESSQVEAVLDFVKGIEEEVIREQDTYRQHAGVTQYRRSALSRFLKRVQLRGPASGLPKAAIKEIDRIVLHALKERFFIFDPGEMIGHGQLDLVDQQKERLNAATNQVLTELEKTAEANARAVYELVRMMLPSMEAEIQKSNILAEEAVTNLAIKAIRKYQRSSWDKDRANAADFQDVFTRIILALRGNSTNLRGEVMGAESGSEIILFVRHANRKDIAERLEEFRDRVQMIVTDDADVTKDSHWVQMADNDFGVPTLILQPGTLETVLKTDIVGEAVSVDAGQKKVYIRPGSETKERLSGQTDLFRAIDQAALETKSQLARTADGVEIHVRASAESPEQIQAAMEQGAAGVGLGRTEYMIDVEEPEFKAWLTLPTAETRRELIRYFTVRFRDMLESVTAINSRMPTTLRTYDFERDKDLKLPNPDKQYGPAFYATPIGRELLKIELLGMLEAGLEHPQSLRIMFPAFRNPIDLKQFLDRETLEGLSAEDQDLLDEQAREDIDLMNQVLDEAFDEIDAMYPDKQPSARRQLGQVRRGFMIETLEGIHNLAAILERADFISVGTTDMTISLFRHFEGISRDNPEHAAKFSELQPEFMETIRTILSQVSAWNTEHKTHIGVDFCGGLAGVDAVLLGLIQAAPVNVKVGISRSPRVVAATKLWIRQVDHGADNQADAAGLIESIAEKLHKLPEVTDALEQIQTERAAQLTETDAGEENGSSAFQTRAERDFAASAQTLPAGFGVEKRIYQLGPKGFHVAPVPSMIKALKEHAEVQVYLVVDGMDMNVRDPFQMMALGLAPGAAVEVKLVGPEEQIAPVFNILENIRDITTVEFDADNNVIPGTGFLIFQKSEDQSHQPAELPLRDQVSVFPEGPAAAEFKDMLLAEGAKVYREAPEKDKAVFTLVREEGSVRFVQQAPTHIAVWTLGAQGDTQLVQNILSGDPEYGTLLLFLDDLAIARSEVRRAQRDSLDTAETDGPVFKALLQKDAATALAEQAALRFVDEHQLGRSNFSEESQALAAQASHVYASPESLAESLNLPVLEAYGRLIRLLSEEAGESEVQRARVLEVMARYLGRNAKVLEGAADVSYQYMDLVDVSELNEETPYALAVLSLMRPKGDQIRLYVLGDHKAVQESLEKVRADYENLLMKFGSAHRTNLTLIDASSWDSVAIQKDMQAFATGKNGKLQAAILAARADFLDEMPVLRNLRRMNRSQVNRSHALVAAPALLAAAALDEHTLDILQMKEELERLGLGALLSEHFAQMVAEIKALSASA